MLAMLGQAENMRWLKVQSGMVVVLVEQLGGCLSAIGNPHLRFEVDVRGETVMMHTVEHQTEFYHQASEENRTVYGEVHIREQEDIVYDT